MHERYRYRYCQPNGETHSGWFDVDSCWNVMAHGDAREGKWRGKWRMEWVASTLHTTSEHGVSSITTADAHISAASSRLNWRPRRFKLTRPFRRKTKSGFGARVTSHFNWPLLMTCGLLYDATRVSDHRNEWKNEWRIWKEKKIWSTQ